MSRSDRKQTLRTRPNDSKVSISKAGNEESSTKLNQNSDTQGANSTYSTHTDADNEFAMNEAVLLDKMSIIMKDTIKDSMKDFRKLLADEITKISKANDESITKLKKDLNSRLKGIETKVDQNKKVTQEKIPQLEQSIAKIKTTVTDETLEKIDSLGGLIPRLEQVEKTVATQQEGHDDLEKSIGYHIQDIESNKSQVENLEAKIKSQQEAIDGLLLLNRKTMVKLEKLQELVNNIDNKQRKYNLVFEGIDEQNGENTKEIIVKLIGDAQIGIDTSGFDSAYRLGKKFANKNRPILVTFSNLTTKDKVLSKIKELKKQANLPSLWVNKDLSEVSRIRSMEVRKCYNLLRENKYKCKLMGSSIEMNNQIFEYKDLAKLPAGCRPENTQMIPCDNNTKLCFQGAHAYMSNFYAVPITYKDKQFTSAEQAFQWRKASHHNDIQAINKILENDDPYIIKKLGEDITTNHNWKQDEEEILFEIVRQKFLQNRDIFDRFVSSPYTEYFECTVGNKWGCGSKLNRIDLDPEVLKGKNKFGEILTQLKIDLCERNRKNSEDPPKA